MLTVTLGESKLMGLKILTAETTEWWEVVRLELMALKILMAETTEWWEVVRLELMAMNDFQRIRLLGLLLDEMKRIAVDWELLRDYTL